MLLSPMQTLRHVRWLVRLVLAGVVMSIGVAGASPMLHPQALGLICSGAGVIELRSHTDGGAVPQSGHQPDCPLCVQVGAPAPGRLADQPPPHPLPQGPRATAAARAPGRPLISCILIAAGASESSASILSGRHIHGPVGIPPNRER